MLLALILFNLLWVFGADAGRHRRYLVYPDGGPARAQFIIGLGVPVDLKEQSVTVGTVIKFQYDLPTNSTEYTSRIYGFAETVSRDMDEDTPTKDVSNEIDSDDSRQLSETEDAVTDRPEGDNDTLVDVTFDDNRRKRSLVYSEGGVLITDSTTIKNEMSLEDAIKRQEMIDQNAIEEEEEPQRMNRWDFYKVIERMVERLAIETSGTGIQGVRACFEQSARLPRYHSPMKTACSAKLDIYYSRHQQQRTLYPTTRTMSIMLQRDWAERRESAVRICSRSARVRY
ncbi:uncharacterized protein LOC110370408 isoform X2 [Helicoverpa armigera]|uniref:uncharacterized protein LOC110370408 isoform X2 n=1 Tax=Helicoverpa armigera TaxID=29058 RepID=UPI003083270A